MKKKHKIWITGNGMVGKSLIRKLSGDKIYEILKTKKTSLNQTDQTKTHNWIKKKKPNTIIITSALVGGIHINSKIPATFLYQNSMINLNIINSAHESGCKRIVFLGASCMYPKFGKQPFKENTILDGKIEETNEGYGLAKILGLKYIEMLNKQYNSSHLSIIPAASYGQNDCYDETKNHVIPALIKRFHDCKIKNKKSIQIWGTGNIKREFIHVDDMADGIIHIIKNYKGRDPINLGTGEEVSIKQLANIVKKVTGYKGKIIFDKTKPDGIKRKILDCSKIRKLKWSPKINLIDGIHLSYNEYLGEIKG